MSAVDKELIRRLPKAELHCHLDGSVRPSTLLELGAAYGKPMPAATPEALADYMRVDDARHLEDYLERFDITLSVMQTREALDRIAYELAMDVAKEGVKYIEVRYAPVLNVREGLSLEQAVEAPLEGLARAEREGGAKGRVIVCGIRNMAPSISMELAELAVAFKGQGVVGFDLAGGEQGNPAIDHADAFRHVRYHDLPCTCHAGEGAGADSVRQAVHVCGAHRLGHATRLIEDASLMDYVIDRQIALEICLTSNVQTRAVDSIEKHPFRAYFSRGANVVLNTDNRLMSGVTLVGEYEKACEHLAFTFDELAQVALNSFESSFLPLAERRALVAEAEQEIRRLRAMPPGSTEAAA